MTEFKAIWLIYLYLLSIFLIGNEARLPNESRCGDKDCSTPISRAKTLVRYSASEEGRVSFPKGIEVDVYRKTEKTWSIKVGEQEGFAPKSFLKELKVYIPTSNLVTVAQDVLPKPVSVDSTQNESADVAIEKTTEIPSVINSLLSFPSMASAESVEGQQQNLPTPSSPQYDVVDGTTIWLDPMPPMQATDQQTIPNMPDKQEQEPSTSSEIIPNAVKTPESSDSTESNNVLPTTVNVEEIAEIPTTPVPTDNFVTPSSDQLESEKQDVTTTIPEVSPEKTIEPETDEKTNTPGEESVEIADPAPDETTESEDIQPTPAGMISSLWNTMFTSGDGIEENSQESEGEEDEEDGEDADEGDEEDGEDGSAEEESKPSSNESAPNALPPQGGKGEITSDIVVENIQQKSASSDDLAASFPHTQDVVHGDNVRIARQIKTESEEVTSDEATEENGQKSALHPSSLEIGEEKEEADLSSSTINNILSNETDGNQNGDYQKEQDGQLDQEQVAPIAEERSDDGQITEGEQEQVQEKEQKPSEEEQEQKRIQEEEEAQKRLQEEQEQKRIQEEEEAQKRIQEEEEAQKLIQEEEEAQKRLQEEQEQKRIQEEEEAQKRLQEEQEQKRLQEEEEAQKRKQEEEEAQKRLQEEQEQKRLQDEEEAQKRLQEEQEQKRIQEEQEQKRIQEEEEAQKRLQEEQEQKRLQDEEKRKREEENQILLQAEQKMIQENEAKQRIREDQMKREREDAIKLLEAQKLRESLEKQREQLKLTPEPQQPVTEGSNILSEPIADSLKNTFEQNIVNSEQDASSLDSETTSEGLFSWFSGLFGSSVETASDQETGLPGQLEKSPESSTPDVSPSHSTHHENPSDQTHEHPPVWSSAHQTMCSASEADCDMTGKSESEDYAGSWLLGIQTPSLDVILLRLVATAVALLIGAVSFYFLRKNHVDSSLVARINELEKQLLVASKEAVILREEVSTVDENVDSEELNKLKEELELGRLVRADLEEQVSTLERELEEATETGIELNKLLSETLEASKGKAHAGLADSVERLQRQLDGQKERVDSLTRSLKSTSAENESLKSLLVENKEKISALEAELVAAADIANNIRREKEEANVLSAQELQQVQSRLEDALSTKVLEESRLHSELSALKLKHETLRSALSMRDAEVKALQDTLKELESNGGKADKLLDVSKVKAELEESKKDKATFEEKYNEEEKARKDLEDRLAKISETLKTLEATADTAEKSREEAETRLAVLSNYFKEKEEQLLKELGLKEAIVAQHRGDESTVVKHLQSLQEEVSTYRAQNESLRKEILDQERDFKAQMATLEKKAHDNWMTARQAERRLEDSRHEAAQLRNRLTLVEKHNADPNARMDANGEGGVTSPVMMMPLPLPPLGDMETPPPLPPFMFSPPPYPPSFMPPPLPPHPMGRPPPLGRMSSPPPPLGQFSPPPPPYDRLDRSSRSPSPPPHRYHHRSPPPPHQWDSPQSSFRPVPKPSPKKPSEHRDHKGSVHNSGHSNELDKSREHV